MSKIEFLISDFPNIHVINDKLIVFSLNELNSLDEFIIKYHKKIFFYAIIIIIIFILYLIFDQPSKEVSPSNNNLTNNYCCI